MNDKELISKIHSSMYHQILGVHGGCPMSRGVHSVNYHTAQVCDLAIVFLGSIIGTKIGLSHCGCT